MIKFDKSKCTGCQACQMACMDQRDIRPQLEEAPLRYVVLKEEPFAYHSIGCIHCGACIKYCAQNAIFRDEDGYVLMDETKCIGCGACMDGCPFGVISMNMESKRAIKCDGCKERIKAGLLPACVHTCPTGALYL